MAVPSFGYRFYCVDFTSHALAGTTRFYRPSWFLLILTYWMALPHRVSVGTSFILGIIVDSIQGSALGVHALSLALFAISSLINTNCCVIWRCGSKLW